ncbi:hypothetical protein [Egicoccus sp. AB-alg6-2]|uniref:hypothetical protein n=1 Tax=Egicoccus sp. AB-alg6-2 TaxID=3242692 RepID=UPI00359CC5FC
MSTTSHCLVLAVLAVVLATLVPVGPARACSCAEMTLQDVAQRDPGAAVARIRRIDDGGSTGVGRVLEVLRGPELPDEVPLALDSGASCLPWVSVGGVAVLALTPERGGWRTMECGLLDPTTGLEPVSIDPEAEGPVAMVAYGSLPGAGLVALDDRLRVLGVGPDQPSLARAEACGELLLAIGHDDTGRTVVTRHDLPSFAQTAQYLPSADVEASIEFQDDACRADGRVDLLLRVWDDQMAVQLHEDVFGDPAVLALPNSGAAAFAGDEVAFLQPGGWSDGPFSLHTLDPATGQRRRVIEHPSGGHEILVSPDGGHALVRGFDDQPLVLAVELATGAVVGESRGWWQPVSQPWVGSDRILLQDEDRGGMSGSGIPSFRLVDLSLTEVAPLPDLGVRTIRAGDGTVVAVTSDALVVLDEDAAPLRTTEQPWLIGVWGTASLGQVHHDHDAKLPPVLAPAGGALGDGATAGASDEVGGGASSVPVVLAAVTAVLVTVATFGAYRRRERVRRGRVSEG